MLSAGISDTQIVDGSLGAGMVYCCGESVSKKTSIWFYVPPELKLEPGDIVEVKMGTAGTGSDPGIVNIAIEVRKKPNDSSKRCQWVPPNEHLWMRVLYCDWMPSAGWVEQQSSLFHAWLKPAAGTLPPG